MHTYVPDVCQLSNPDCCYFLPTFSYQETGQPYFRQCVSLLLLFTIPLNFLGKAVGGRIRGLVGRAATEKN